MIIIVTVPDGYQLAERIEILEEDEETGEITVTISEKAIPFGRVWGEFENLQRFINWHDTGEQRSLKQVHDDGELEPQIEWYLKGGHLIEEGG